MKLLFDTHLLLWALAGSDHLPERALGMLLDPNVEPLFSAASIWEIGIKHAKGSPDFNNPPSLIRAALLESGYTELPITSQHGIAASALHPHHRDPFDRILIGQAQIEGCALVTHDGEIAKYAAAAPIIWV